MKQKLLVIIMASILCMGYVAKAHTKARPMRKNAATQKSAAGLATIRDTSLQGPEAVDLERQMHQSSLLCALGRKAFSRSDFAAAEEDFRQALAAYPRSDEAKTGLAQALEGEGRSDEASNAYRDAFKRADALSSYSTFPNDIAALARHGILSEEAGRHQEAVKSYNMARQWLNNKAIVPLNASFDPKGPPTPQLRAMLEVVRGVALMDSKNQDGQDRSTEALEAFSQAAALQPNDAHVQFYHGYGLRKAGQFAQAQAAFRRATALDTEGTVKAAAEENLRAVQAHRR
jgi:Flp pilus assembly protein TadD